MNNPQDEAANHELAELEVLALRVLHSKRYSQADAVIRVWLDQAIHAGQDDLQIAGILTSLAEFCHRRRKYEESARLYDEALMRYERWFRATLNTRRFRKPTTRHARSSLRASLAHCMRTDIESGPPP